MNVAELFKGGSVSGVMSVRVWTRGPGWDFGRDDEVEEDEEVEEAFTRTHGRKGSSNR